MIRWLSLHAPALLHPLAVGLLLALGQPAAAQAQNQIFVCDDGKGAPPRYQNSAEKGCRRLDLPPINSVPAPKLPASASKPQASAATAARSSFPRVDAAAQRERDGDRQRLLNDELKREQDRLAELQREFNNGEPERRGDERNYQKYLDRVEGLRQAIGRAETSISSLERELGSTRN